MSQRLPTGPPLREADIPDPVEHPLDAIEAVHNRYWSGLTADASAALTTALSTLRGTHARVPG